MRNVMMDNFFIDLQDFDNMPIQDNRAALRYTVKITNRKTGEYFLQKTMEFVKFKDNGGDIRARVIEGWDLSDQTLA